MAIVVTTDVFCDRCVQWEHGVTSHKAAASEARATAKAKGWARMLNQETNKVEDVCPGCIKRIKTP